MTKNYYWLKLHFDILEDWKVGTLPDSLKWRFIQCLIVAGKNGGDGWLPDMNQFAFGLHMDKDALKADLARLASNQLVELAIDEDGNERWFVTNYLKRQKKIDVNDRVQAFRERQRKEAVDNATVTQPLRNGNDNVTSRYTDKIRVEIDKSRNRVDVDKSAHTHPQPYDDHEENQNRQELLDVITDICNVAKGQNAFTPSDDLRRAATGILETGGADRVSGFGQWWKTNGYYPGKPALKSLVGEWDNYIDGASLNDTGSSQLTQTQRIAQKVEAKYNGMDN